MLWFQTALARRVGVVIAATLLAAAPLAAQPTCRGRDVMPELAAQKPDVHARIMREAAATTGREALLWRIEKAGVSPSHLFGTMHLADPRIATLSEQVQAAIKGSRRIAVEVTDLAKAAAAVMTRMPQNFVYMDGRRVDADLEGNEFAVLETAATAAGLPKATIPVFRPWFLIALLALPDCARPRDGANKPVLDAVIESAAKRQGKPVLGLETAEEQFNAMQAIPEADQIAMLKGTLRTIDKREDMLETMIQLYLNRQIAAIWSLQLHQSEEAGIPAERLQSFRREIIAKRNRRMLERSLPMLAEGGAFIAVGALHNIGADGLVKLYRDAGYTVTPVE